jgi:hypothetical protein
MNAPVFPVGYLVVRQGWPNPLISAGIKDLFPGIYRYRFLLNQSTWGFKYR